MEKVQKRATKLVHECNRLPYTERLKYLNLPTLKYRRHRGDMIEKHILFLSMAAAAILGFEYSKF